MSESIDAYGCGIKEQQDNSLARKRHPPIVDWMFGQRRRHWTNIASTLGRCIVFPGRRVFRWFICKETNLFTNIICVTILLRGTVHRQVQLSYMPISVVVGCENKMKCVKGAGKPGIRRAWCRSTFPEWRPHMTFTDTSLSTSALAFLITYAIIAGVGILGNALVIIIIAALPALRTTQNIFIVNLCFSDILLGLGAMFAFVDEVDDEWMISTGSCRFFGFVSMLPPTTIVLSMVIVAKIRYSAIVVVTGCTRQRLTRRKAALYLTIIWGVAILLALPVLLGWVSVRGGLFCACCFSFSDNIFYGLVVTSAVYIIPNILISIYYIKIFAHVRKSHRKVEQHKEVTCRTTSASSSAKELHLAIQFLVLFLIFNICYLPCMLVFWIEDDYNTLSAGAKATMMLLFALNLILNPIAYFVLNKNIRRHLHIKLCVKSRKKNMPANDNMNTDPSVEGGDIIVRSSVSEDGNTCTTEQRTSVEEAAAARSRKCSKPIEREIRDKQCTCASSDCNACHCACVISERNNFQRHRFAVVVDTDEQQLGDLCHLTLPTPSAHSSQGILESLSEVSFAENTDNGTADNNHKLSGDTKRQ